MPVALAIFILFRSSRNTEIVVLALPFSQSYLAPTSALLVVSGASSALLAASAKVSPEGWNDRLHDT
ncbi:hypothetical protein D3C72_1786530 [compost metagenome]